MNGFEIMLYYDQLKTTRIFSLEKGRLREIKYSCLQIFEELSCGRRMRHLLVLGGRNWKQRVRLSFFVRKIFQHFKLYKNKMNCLGRFPFTKGVVERIFVQIWVRLESGMRNLQL